MSEEIIQIIQDADNYKIMKELKEHKELINHENVKDVIKEYFKKGYFFGVMDAYDFFTGLYNEKEIRMLFIEEYLKTNDYSKNTNIKNLLEKTSEEERSEVLEKILNPNVSFDYKERYIAEFLGMVPYSDRSPKLIDMIAKQVDITTKNTRELFLKNIPKEIQTSEFYSSILKNIQEKMEYVKNNDTLSTNSYARGQLINAYIDVFKKVPENAKTCELLMNAFYIIPIKDITEDLKLLDNDFREKGKYSQFFKNIYFREPIYFSDVISILNTVPKDILTEENIGKIFEGLIEKKEKVKYYEAANVLDAVKKVNNNLSYDFYKNIILSIPDGNGMMIYNRIPKEYRTDDMIYASIKGNLSSPNNIYELLEKEFPQNESYSEVYPKIINIIKNNLEDNDQKAMCYTFLNNSIGSNVKDWDEREKFRDSLIETIIDDVKTIKDRNGNILYTPMAVKNCYENFIYNSHRLFKNQHIAYMKMLDDKTKIYEYFSKIIEIEKYNIDNKIDNPEQTKIYETELYGKSDDNTKEKNPFWNLCAILNIMPDEIKEKNREDIYEIIKNSLATYNNPENAKVTEYLQEIMDTNEELFLTLDNDFFKTDKYLNLFGKEKYEVLIAYPQIQSFISQMNDTQLNMFANFIEYTEKNYEMQKSTQLADWVPVANILIKGMQNEKKFGKINKVIEEQKFNELPEDLKQKYIHVISKNENWYDINTIEDLNNYENIRKEICLKILSGSTDHIPSNIAFLKNREKMIFARLQLEFGLDINEAQNLVKKYGEGLSENQKNSAIGKTLQRLQKILNIDDKNLDELKEGVDNLAVAQTDLLLMQVWESKCRESYMAEYQNSVYKVNDKDTVVEKYNSEYDGKKINVYESNEDFNMFIHCLGAYSEHAKREDYKKDWNMPKVVNHGLCTSFIGNNNLGTAQIGSVAYGFSDFTEEQLQLSSPWDIISRYANENFSISSVGYDYKNGIWFCNSKQLIDNTRHTHNEIVFERRQFFKDGSSKKMQPSYIIYMPEYFKGKTPKEIEKLLENREEEINVFMQNDPKWEEAKKAATQFNIPIVLVDRANVALKEKNKIEEMMYQLETTHNTSLIAKIINEFENNRTGNREYHPEICGAFFSDKILDGYIDKIESIIQDLPSQTQRKNAYTILKNSFTSEIEKREKFQKTEDDQISKMWKDLLINASRSEKSLQKIDEMELETTLKKVSKNNEQIVSLIDDKVFEEVADMKERNLYSDKKAHSDRHIQDVMLFAEIIGKKEKLSDKDMKILLESAKFHDSGRNSDNDRNHAEPSARIAGEKLKELYEPEELKIIQIAIEYHEAREGRKGYLDENILNNLFEKYGIDEPQKDRIKTISRILKDADALDRTRFVNKAKLDVDYLHTEFAKSLADFALQINEEYAHNDILDYYSIDGISKEMLDEYIGTMKKEEKSNLEIARNIRNNILTHLKKSTKTSMEELKQNSQEISQEEIREVKMEIIEISQIKNEVTR